MRETALIPSDIVGDHPAVSKGFGLDGYGVGWRYITNENPATYGFTSVPGTKVDHGRPGTL